MNILIIGGTRFAGYFATDYALARGHAVTLFNRGQSAPDAFPNAEHITGDRDADIERLRGRRWDAVIDTSGYMPRVVRKSAELLAGSVDRYLFISTISVYAELSAPGTDETGTLTTLADPTTEDKSPEFYGGLKVLCEQAVEQIYPGRSVVVRPGLIVGPRDPTNRFDYWVERVTAGGETLAPGTPDYPVQFIDARDLGEWLIRLVEAQQTGLYNATGPTQPFGAFLEMCRMVSGSDARFTWVSEPFLLERDVEAWSELPLWATEAGRTHNQISNARAIAAGLTFRTLPATVRATLDWLRANPEIIAARRSALTREREQSLLRDWHAAQS